MGDYSTPIRLLLMFILVTIITARFGLRTKVDQSFANVHPRHDNIGANLPKNEG